MTNTLQYSALAISDLDEIWDYFADECDSIEAAELTVNTILGSAENLKEFPEMGTSLNKIIPIESNYRFLVSGHYLIFYRIEERYIYIDRIIHFRRNYISILFGEIS